MPGKSARGAGAGAGASSRSRSRSESPSRRAKASADRTSATSGPKLLSGGNPQIPKGDGDEPVQSYISAMPDWKRDVGRQIDALVERVVPGARKAVRWNSPFYGIEGQGWFLSYHCFNKYVKVTFLRGTKLRPQPPVESKDPNTRYFHVGEGGLGDDENQIADWVRQAAEIPGDPLF